MAAFNKFQQFVGDLGTAKINLNADTFNALLTLTAPNTADIQYNGTAGPPAQIQSTSNAAEIAAGNGYSAGGAAIPTVAYSQTAGTGTMTAGSVVWTCVTSAMASFRYVTIYDATSGTSSTRSLIGYYDYGSTVTLAVGETFTVSWASGILTIA